MNEALQTSTIRHQVYLERLKAGQANQTAVFLKNVEKSIRERLKASEELTKFARRRLEVQLVAVDKMLSEIFDNYYEELAGSLADIGHYESEFEARNLTNAATGSFEAIIPAPKQVSAAVFTSPMSVRGPGGGKLLKDFIQDYTAIERKGLVSAIRQGYFEGQTNDQIITNIRGVRQKPLPGKKALYTGGVIQASHRHIESVVRTSVQHVANTARMETWKENRRVVKGYRWLSTLDGRTSSQCRSLDSRVFEIGKGPVPPVHIGCRSTTIAELDDRFSFLQKGRTRASMDGPVSADIDYYDWLKTQKGIDFQNDAIGLEKANLLRNGGLSSKEFARLNLNKNFEPLTLVEMRRKEPIAFGLAEEALPLTKKAELAKILESKQRSTIEEWVGEKTYRRLVGETQKDRVKGLALEYGMTQAEQVAITHYTGTGYKELNQVMWGLKHEKSAIIKESAEVLRSALDKMPSYEDMTYRRTTVPKATLALHQIGEVVDYPAFTSSSHTKEVFTGKHRFLITGKNGKALGWISRYADREREVVFTSPSKFIVEDRYLADDGILTIEMTEL